MKPDIFRKRLRASRMTACWSSSSTIRRSMRRRPTMRAGLFAAIGHADATGRDQRRRHHRRRAQFRRRRRHPRIRRADGRADAAAGDRAHRGERQAGGRGDQRRGARRRPGDRARLSPPHRRRRGKARPARGEARHRARRRRDATPAAACRRGGGGRADRQRPHRRRPPRRCRSASSTKSRQATSIAEAVAVARDLVGETLRRTGELAVPPLDAEAFEQAAAKALSRARGQQRACRGRAPRAQRRPSTRWPKGWPRSARHS